MWALKEGSTVNIRQPLSLTSQIVVTRYEETLRQCVSLKFWTNVFAGIRNSGTGSHINSEMLTSFVRTRT